MSSRGSWLACSQGARGSMNTPVAAVIAPVAAPVGKARRRAAGGDSTGRTVASPRAA